MESCDGRITGYLVASMFIACLSINGQVKTPLA